MRYLSATVMVAVVMLTAPHNECAAQEGPRGQHSPLTAEESLPDVAPVKPGERSTLTGVYTEAQAVRGDSLFGATCASCHEPPNEPIALERLWGGRLIVDLFNYASKNTPRDAPGSLRPQQYADIIAYILWLNDIPAGANELPVSDSVLSTIRIETKPAQEASIGRALRPGM